MKGVLYLLSSHFPMAYNGTSYSMRFQRGGERASDQMQNVSRQKMEGPVREVMRPDHVTIIDLSSLENMVSA